ncbi:MAG: hypothetical protein J3R72DRAFT_494501 [Linnemannia gamsii]|nr:MAG: hypothetical protein J3R72DRAFT_494501 [Linnemannia gamsii]
MPTNYGPKPYHPDPLEERNMDGVEAASPEYSTQEFNNAVAIHQARTEPEFITVSRTKAIYQLKFPVSCFDKGTSLTVMSTWAIKTLQKVATIKPKSFSIVTLPTAANTMERYMVFQVYTSHESNAACKHGSATG